MKTLLAFLLCCSTLLARPADHPREASVRVKAYDSRPGTGGGSGTIIEVRERRALVMTAAHVVDGQGADARYEVHAFDWDENTPTHGRIYVAKLLTLDKKADVALLTFTTDDDLPVVKLFPSGRKLESGMATVTVGCDHGKLPTVVAGSLTKLDVFLGPQNVQAVPQPVQGRSGGGLFVEGMLAGVCSSSDSMQRAGSYMGPMTMYGILERAGLYHLFRGSEHPKFVEHERKIVSGKLVWVPR